LKFAILAGELAGPQEAKDRLNALEALIADSTHEPTNAQAESLASLEQLYADYLKKDVEGGSISFAQRTLLAARLGWFGKLGLAHPESADVTAREEVVAAATKTMISMLAFMMLALAYIGCGLCGGLAFAL